MQKNVQNVEEFNKCLGRLSAIIETMKKLIIDVLTFNVVVKSTSTYAFTTAFIPAEKNECIYAV